MPVSLGERILLLRRQYRPRLTQARLAQQVGLHANTIARIERCEIESLRGDTIAKLARFFATSTDYLLGLSDLDPGATPVRWRAREQAAQPPEMPPDDPQHFLSISSDMRHEKRGQ
jgi:transcriptional regulator with XRE-family HTH domain